MQPPFSLDDIVHGDVAQLDGLFQAAAAPASAANLRTSTAEKICAFLLKSEHFDALLATQIGALKTHLVQHIAKDDNFYCTPENSLRKAIDLIIQRGSMWYSRDSKSSQQFFEKISLLVHSCSLNVSDQLFATIDQTQQWFAGEEKRASMLETRLCETEINHFKIVYAERAVIDLINASLTERPFPQDLVFELASTLKSELLNAYIISGTDSPFIKTWKGLLPIIGKTFYAITQVELNEGDEQYLYRTIPAILHELDRSLNISTSNPGIYRQWVEHLSEYLMRAVKKQPVECAPFVALGYPDGQDNINTSVTADLLKQTDDIQPDDWILFNNENEQTIRCKLALKNPQTDQLLFVDHTGRKVMVKSIKDFALCLSTGIAKKMTAISTDEVIRKIVQALIDLHHQKKSHVKEKQEIANAKAVAQKELQEKADAQRKLEAEIAEKKRIAHELTARRAAAQKALAEAAILANERTQRASELKQLQAREKMSLEAAQAAEHLQRVQLANIHISSLNLGARVELNQNGESLRCKLAVIIAATGKYIFADNIGRKIAEFQREQLVQALLDNQLTLLSNSNSFDDQLVKVIRGLRKDIS